MRLNSTSQRFYLKNVPDVHYCTFKKYVLKIYEMFVLFIKTNWFAWLFKQVLKKVKKEKIQKV